jgi:hypothetical protein
MFRDVLGQTVGVVAIASWLGLVVYCMSRAATPNATDSGNWFILFALITVVFVGMMAYWKRVFAKEDLA